MGMTWRLLVFVGFALGHRVSAIAYLTAFGVLDSGVGYVAAPEFTVAANVTAVAASVAVVVLSSRSARPFFLPYVLLAVASGCAFGVVALFDVAVSSASLVVLGVMYGLTFFVMNTCWFEVMAFDSPFAATTVFLLAYLASSGLAPVFDAFPVPVAWLAIPCLFLSAVALAVGRRVCLRAGASAGAAKPASATDRCEEAGRNQRPLRRANAKEILLALAMPVGAACVLECTTGLVNMSLIGGSLEYVVSTFPTWLASLSSSVLLLAAIAVTRKSPQPLAVFEKVFPILLAALLLLLLLGEEFGALAGLILVISYNLIASSLVYFLFSVARRYHVSILLLQGASNACVKLSLVLGFVIGHGLLLWSETTAGASGFIITVFAVYLLAIAAFFLRGHGIRRGRASADLVGNSDFGDPESDGLRAATQSASDEGRRQKAIDQIADRFALTKREREVYGYLVRGWGAKQIAKELYLSENTVWGHVRHIYTKLGVNAKQEAINLFEEQLGK